MNKHHILGVAAIAASLASLPAQWAQANPATSPGPRAAAGMATDAAGNLILFGGDTGGFPSPATNQTWRYDDTTWTQLSPTTSPTPKLGITLVYDTNRGVFVSYGSLNTSIFGGASVDQTWEFNGTTWTQVTPTTTPGGLGGYGACFDSLRNKLVLYGGLPDNFFPIDSNQTWEYDGTNWALITTTGSPGPLENPAMCFHAGLGQTILFGGIDVQIGGNDTTWAYDGTNWTALPVTGSKPPVRTGARMVYDPFRGVCVLTGGSDPTNGQPIVDTWEFDGAAWTQVPSVTSGRSLAMLAFLPGRRQVVEFGGFNPLTFSYFGDTWEYGAKSRSFGSGCAGSAGVPTLTASDAPRLGAPYTLTIGNLNPTVNVGVVVIGLTELPGVALDPIGMTGCLGYVSADLLVTVTGTGGSAAWTWSPVSGPLGATFVAQGLSLDPSINPAWLVASNAVGGVLGY